MFTSWQQLFYIMPSKEVNIVDKNKTEFKGILIDSLSRRVFLNGTEVRLMPQEFNLLSVLLAYPDCALSREKLLLLAWGYSYAGDTRTVDVHIQRLRRKLGLENTIQTVFKLGYRLNASAN